MLQEAGVKLTAFHEAQKALAPVVVPFTKG
jgi:hypothetical protein